MSKNYQKICIFVKRTPRNYRPFLPCTKANATQYLDLIDHEAHLDDLYTLATDPIKAPSIAHNWKQYKLLLQSQYLINLVQRYGLKAYLYPHHHSNFMGWGVSAPSNRKSNLVVGLLVGNIFRMPDVSTVLLPAICAANARLRVINQDIRVVKHDGYSEVNAIVQDYDCRRVNATAYFFNQTTKSTRTSIAGDTFQQAAFYLDKSFRGVDVGILWPNTNDLKYALNLRNGSKQNTPQEEAHVEMIRPPTRLLHWLSRGVPSIYYPTHSYQYIAEHTKYGQGFTSPHGKHSALEIFSEASILSALQLLSSPAVRQKLSEQAIAAAKLFSPRETAIRLMNILELSMK